MMAKYKAYPEYKDSGVEWLGEIPAHWLIKKLKYLCKVQTGSRDTVNAVENGRYPFFVRSQTIERINSVGAECEAVLTAGDGVGVGKVYHYYNGKFDFHQRVYMLNEFHSITGKFVYYYLSSNFYKVALEGNAKSTVDSLRLPQFLNFEFSIPKLDEQKNLILFIEHETAKIDNLIEKQQILIELLKEKRQAMISHTVTKGLNPDAPMKDSGVEWLGEVPAHWDICLLKFKCSAITDGAHISPDTNEGEHYFVSIKDIKKGIIDFNNSLLTSSASYKYLVKTGCKPFSGDILFSKDGTIGQTAIVPDDVDFVVASSLIIIRADKEKALPAFMDLLLQSSLVKEQVESFVKGAALRRLSIQNLEKVFGVFPTLSEQLMISDYIYAQLNRLDVLESKAVAQIQLLEERRTALISAAVTGKIDVRDWVAPDTQDIEEPQEATA
ncbi:restriction endonuclease subunit S [Klebsiella aerogenes]|nr:restriction endonuclease subunit S [Klebsiella aerogenes]EIW9499399.1 restriction endonuclease subunit S [Klebsiella aerogenes]MCB4371836.1 restriction endonuclease subunit S [Klebsiella aerogenes]OWP40086.1 restriction endonuclease subunit S [Klebsiella aerogenes]QII35840.1 restriction endonuclease subunit S [Klebsiella aerogenes]